MGEERHAEEDARCNNLAERQKKIKIFEINLTIISTVCIMEKM